MACHSSGCVLPRWPNPVYSSWRQIYCPRPAVYDVHQCSVFGPLLFMLYTADIGKIIQQYDLSHRSYADDNQLYSSCNQHESAALKSSRSANGCQVIDSCWINPSPSNPSNASARLACGLHKYDHITPARRDRLHWLPMQQRITYKLCLLTFKGIQGVAPPYIVDLCKRVNTIESRRRLRSAAGGQLIVPRTFTDFGIRAFAYAGPSA